MPVLPDPAVLAAIADRIAAHAAAARDRAIGLDRAVATTGWAGAAAGAFDLEARVATDALRTAAARLDEAADALRRHAARIGTVLADVARLDLAGIELAKDAVTHPDRLLADSADVVGAGLHVVEDGVGVLGGALDALGL
jgi:hypothetical protein